MAIQTITLLLNIYDMFDLMKVIRGGRYRETVAVWPVTLTITLVININQQNSADINI